MSARRADLPGPDMRGTDLDAVLRSRINLGAPSGAPTPAHTRPHTGTDGVRTGTGRRRRPDPEGMRRLSLYVTVEAAAALEAAADQILATLGEGTPRHVALSALLQAGAAQAEAVAADLARRRAAELAERLAALQQPPV